MIQGLVIVGDDEFISDYAHDAIREFSAKLQELGLGKVRVEVIYSDETGMNNAVKGALDCSHF